MWWRKKQVVETHYKKDDRVSAWQFTKASFTEGVPRFISHDKEKRISLWSQYGGNKIEGTLKTKDGSKRIFENDWIVLRHGEFQVYSESLFEAFFHTVKERI